MSATRYLSKKIIEMIKNMGTTDKRVRLGLAVVIALLYYFNVISGTLSIILLVLAIVFALTSLLSFCPLYTLVGMNTCKK
jgi:hypothetical protein